VHRQGFRSRAATGVDMRRLIQSYADAQAASRPTARAVVLGNRQLTYSELYQWSNALARALQSQGCQPGDRVGLLLSKAPLAIASILGILKADCICVPLDVESPAARLAKILDNSEPRLLLVDTSGKRILRDLRSHTAKLSPIAAIKAASIERANTLPDEDSYVFGLDDILECSGEPMTYRNAPDEAAYLLYTSGSTGVPKGVAVTHNSVAHFIDWATRYFKFTPGDRISGHPPLHFDLSLFDIFGTFSSGAELHLVPASFNLSAADMSQFIRSSELTQWFSVPSALNYMAKFNTVRPGDFPDLKRILWCGEVLPTSTLRYWMERLPGVEFTNLYGPTEATIASSYYTVPALPGPNESIPIGRPCEGESLLVLDETLAPVTMDTIGQLYIGGVGLSPGYWKDEEKSRAAFLQSPDGGGRLYKTGDLAKVGRDGLIYFVGRADNQTKSRGYRIELGEIEAALNCIPDLKESAVVAIPTREFEGSLICCAFAPVEGARVTIITLREALRGKLPNYMLPGRWLSLDRLPKNTNGKIDRPLLKELFRSDTDTAKQKDCSEVQSMEV
jgi:amino acid adenylation domain-containing protein